eukprot:1353319-Amorphochlora_amoeboformis.AAC.2
MGVACAKNTGASLDGSFVVSIIVRLPYMCVCLPQTTRSPSVAKSQRRRATLWDCLEFYAQLDFRAALSSSPEEKGQSL